VPVYSDRCTLEPLLRRAERFDRVCVGISGTPGTRSPIRRGVSSCPAVAREVLSTLPCTPLPRTLVLDGWVSATRRNPRNMRRTGDRPLEK